MVFVVVCRAHSTVRVAIDRSFLKTKQLLMKLRHLEVYEYLICSMELFCIWSNTVKNMALSNITNQKENSMKEHRYSEVRNSSASCKHVSLIEIALLHTEMKLIITVSGHYSRC